MGRENFTLIEDEDGNVIYDESDDYVPEESQMVDDELDMEYLLKQENLQAAEYQKQRWVSAVVIVGVILFITVVCYINFKNILF